MRSLRQRLVSAVMLAIAIAACGSSVPSVPAPTQGDGPPPASIDPDWVTRPAYSCGGPAFPPAAMDAPLGAEQGRDEAAAALRQLIQEYSGAVGGGVPVGGWRRVLDTPDRVLFIVPGPGDRDWTQIGLMRAGAAWTMDVVGDCDLRVVMPDDRLTVADWWVEPGKPVDPGATSISILVLERACANGKDAAGRILPPIITLTPDVVSVVVATQNLGNADCPGNPPTPFVLELPEPLGGRALLDGGTVPPRQPVPIG